MRSRFVLFLPFIWAFSGQIVAEDGDYFAIMASHVDAGRDNVSIIFTNLDINSTNFDIENVREEDTLIWSTTVDPKHMMLFVLPTDWRQNHKGDRLHIDIVTTPNEPSKQFDEIRLSGQIKLAHQPKVLIQLNHVLHTPGDFMKFRILLTEALNRPMAESDRPFNMTVALLHETQNTVKSWNEQLFPGKIYTGEYLFGDDRDLGSWNISVTIGDLTTTKAFHVRSYSPPIHKLTIKPKGMTTVDDKHLELAVDGRYTFGKPIHGTLTLSVSGDRVSTQTLSFPGERVVVIPLTDILTVPHRETSEPRIIHVNATVTTTNQLTERTFQKTTTVPIYPVWYAVSLQRLVPFAPGHNATLLINVTRADGGPVKREKLAMKTVSVKVDFDGEEPIPGVSVKQALTEDGTAIISVPTDEAAEKLTAQVTFLNASSSMTLETAFGPQLSLRIVPSKNTSDYVLRIASSHPLDGVLAVVRKHNGENIPLYINCHMRYFHDHPVSDQGPLGDVKRVYAFAKFEDTLMQTATDTIEPALNHAVEVTVENSRIRVRTKDGKSHVGVAVYEGTLDADQLKSIRAHSMFEGSVYPEIEDVFTLSTKDLLISTPLEQSETSAMPPEDDEPKFSRLLLWEKGISRNGEKTFTFQPPSHVNRWTVAAFAFGSTKGLGIAEPVQGQNQKDVEIYIHVPYSTTKLEDLLVDVYVVNNGHQAVKFLLLELLNHANEFLFLNNSGHTDAEQKTVYGRLEPNEVQRAEFLIRPKKLGTITLKANLYAADTVASAETIIRTVPEYEQHRATILRVIDIDKSEFNLKNLDIPIPRTAERGTEKITFTMRHELHPQASLPANVLLDKLIEADPFTTAVKASLVLDVLSLGNIPWSRRTHTATEMVNASTTKIESLINDDGSFTLDYDHAFSSKSWDTIIAVQALTIASTSRPKQSIAATISTALTWLKGTQTPDGHFCNTNHTEPECIELTAHALLTFLNPNIAMWRFVTVIENAQKYLQSRQGLRNPYHLALVGHALQLSLRHVHWLENRDEIQRHVNYLLDELLTARKKSLSGSKTWWTATGSGTDLETTAYALMLLTSKRRLFDAVPLVNWMKGQPYRSGAPAITPNSHVALRALIEYAMVTTFVDKRYDARVEARNKTGVIERYELQNTDQGRVLILPANTRSVSFSINGTMTGALEINYSYMESVTQQTQKFAIDVKRYSTSNSEYTDWGVCLRFVPRSTMEKTRMVTCEISFPTGYIALDDSVDELRDLDNLVAISSRNDETLLLITFEEVDLRGVCFNVTGFRRGIVGRRLPGTIKVFDLTDKTNVAFKQFDTVM